MARRAILLVDHGSSREEASAFLEELAELVRARAGVPVHVAHMEIAAPSIAAGVRACVDEGVEAIVVVPCFLAPGRHAKEDVPRLVEEAIASVAPELAWQISEPLGAHPLLADLVLLRAGADRWA